MTSSFCLHMLTTLLTLSLTVFDAYSIEVCFNTSIATPFANNMICPDRNYTRPLPCFLVGGIIHCYKSQIRLNSGSLCNSSLSQLNISEYDNSSDYTSYLDDSNCNEDDVSFLRHNGVLLEITSAMRVNVSYNVSSPLVVNMWREIPKFTTSLPSKKRVSTYYVTFEQPTFHIVSANNASFLVYIAAPGMSQQLNCTSPCSFNALDSFFIDSIPIDLFIYEGTLLAYQNNFDVTAFSRCPIPINPFSAVWSQTWSCSGITGRFIIVMACLGSAILILILLSIAGLLLYWSWIRCCPGLTNSLKVIVNNVPDYRPSKPKRRRSVSYSASSDSSSDETDKMNQKLQMLTGGRKGIKGNYALCIFFCAIMLPCASAMLPCDTSAPQTDLTIRTCQYTFSVSSISTTCNTTGYCTFNLNSIITFNLLHQTVCIDVVDPNTGDMVIRLQIFYKARIVYVPFRFRYVTSTWQPIAYSDKGCASTSTCPFSGCPLPGTSVFSGISNNIFSGLDPTVWNSARVACTASCGCAGCGCFFCNDGCMWTFYDQFPTNEAWGVYDVDAAYTYPQFEVLGYNEVLGCYSADIIVDFHTGTTPVSTVFGTTSSNFTTPLSFTIIAGVETPIETQDNLLFCSYTSNTYEGCYYGPGSPSGGPIPGLPGDIQFATSTDYLANINKKWSPTAIQQIPHQSDTTFIFPNIGGNIIKAYPAFGPTPISVIPPQYSPTIRISNIDFSLSSFAMIGLALDSPPISIGVITSATIELQYPVTTVCPAFTIVSWDGCSDCTQGATVGIKAISSCSAGFTGVTITGPGRPDEIALVGTGNVYVDTVETNQLIVFYPSVEIGTWCITLRDGSQSATQCFDGFFQLMTILQNGTEIIVNTNGSASVSAPDFSDWWASLSGVWAWLKWVGAVGIGMVVVGGIVAGIIGIVYLYIRIKSPGYSAL